MVCVYCVISVYINVYFSGFLGDCFYVYIRLRVCVICVDIEVGVVYDV